MQISIMIEGQGALSWQRWQTITSAVERLGFATLYRSDHFTMPTPPNMDALELVVALTEATVATRRVKFGSLVAPLSFRDPIMLARQAMQLNDLSGGRMILGIGAGWQEREHTMFGYPLDDPATRFARFEEGVAVIAALMRNPQPVTFEGRFYHLKDAVLLPRPARPTPILLGGSGPKRTLPLVARFADIWNAPGASPGEFAASNALLDQLLAKHNRAPSEVMRSVMFPALFWRDEAEREQRLSNLRGTNAPFAGKTNNEVLAYFTSRLSAAVGSPEDVLRQIHAYAAAGAQEAVIQWWGIDDIDGLEVFAEQVMAKVAA